MGKESASVLAGEDEMQRRGANLLLLGVSGSSLVILKAGYPRGKPGVPCADPPSPGVKAPALASLLPLEQS